MIALQANGAWILRAEKTEHAIAGVEVLRTIPEASPCIDFLTYDGDHIMQVQVPNKYAMVRGWHHGQRVYPLQA